MFSICRILKKALWIIYNTSKLYLCTLCFLGVYIPMQLVFGAILLTVLLFLLGIVPLISGVFAVPLLISTVIAVSLSFVWLIAKQMIQTIDSLLCLSSELDTLHPFLTPFETIASVFGVKFQMPQKMVKLWDYILHLCKVFISKLFVFCKSHTSETILPAAKQLFNMNMVTQKLITKFCVGKHVDKVLHILKIDSAYMNLKGSYLEMLIRN